MISPFCKSWAAAVALDEELGGRDRAVRRRADCFWLVDAAQDRLTEIKAALGQGESAVAPITRLAWTALKLLAAANPSENGSRRPQDGRTPLEAHADIGAKR